MKRADPESTTAGRASKSQRARSRPFVFINMAMTADGKIATANRAVSSFGSQRDRTHLLELRATADAVMAGARTIDSNRVTLGPGPERFRRLRLRRGLAEYNLRIVVSRQGTVNLEAEVFKKKFSPILILTTRQAGVRRLKALRQVADEVRVCGTREIDFRDALEWLHQGWGVRRLCCEGGGELNDALLRAGLVDELHLTICPILVGGRSAPTIMDGTGWPSLSQATKLTLTSARRHGRELFLVYRVAGHSLSGVFGDALHATRRRGPTPVPCATSKPGCSSTSARRAVM